MEKQMINGFFIPFAHPTPVNHHHILLSQIILRKNLAKGGRPNEESHSRQGFSAPYTLPRKWASSFRNNLIVKRSHLKLSFFVRIPSDLVTPTNQIERVKKTIKRSQLFNFPIQVSIRADWKLDRISLQNTKASWIQRSLTTDVIGSRCKTPRHVGYIDHNIGLVLVGESKAGRIFARTCRSQIEHV